MSTIAENTESLHFPGVISPAQIKAAMGLLDIKSEKQLAEMAGVSRSLVQKFLRGQNVRDEYVQKLQHAIEEHGVFPLAADQWGGEGVRFVK